MEMYDIILKKRMGEVLSGEEIRYFVDGYTKGSIPDYQASALLMAIMFQQLSPEEIFELTDAMKSSGDTINLSKIKGIKVDKHSTGGVGDKTTLIVGPIAAACGVPIAKMSGRGLGFTGGTVDKLESIPGLITTLDSESFISQVSNIGLAVIGQTGHIAPADKKIYALRDVTATVDNLGLIASSIMSKKLAAGADAILLDVKCGSGAFMKTFADAELLGKTLVNIGNRFEKRTVAAITDMNQPLGYAIGNSLEVIEAIHTLKGQGPKDITELSLELAGIMIYLGKQAESIAIGKEMAENAVNDGSALKMFERFIKAQNGNAMVIEDESLFSQPYFMESIIANTSGFVSAIEANQIGLASQHAGAGRSMMGESIDSSAGILLHKKVGDQVAEGEILATIQGNQKNKISLAKQVVQMAFHIEKEKPVVGKLIYTVVGLDKNTITHYERSV